MDPPIIDETSFLAANPSSYSLTEIWPFPINGNGGVGEPSGGLNLRMSNLSEFGEAALNRDVSVDESTVKEKSGSRGGGSGGGRKPRDANSEDVSSKLISTSCGNHLNDSNGKRMKKIYGSQDENGGSKSEVEGSSGAGNKPAEQSTKPSELPKQDYIHVRARRGQATDSHSLAERARREKISERMKILQDLVPGCNKIIGKALVLDEIINYIQSLQRQVELAAVNLRMNPIIESFPSKDNDSNGKRTKNIYGSQEENGGSESVEASSETGNKPAEQSTKPSEPPKEDHIHVRARRGQATDTQSLAERVRRENISKRMKILIDLVPGCNKVIGKVLVLDEIINYIQSLQRQVEFLSMKLEAANLRMNPSIEGFKKNDGHSVTKSKGLMVRAFRSFLSSMEYLSGCFRCSKSHRIHNI